MFIKFKNNCLIHPKDFLQPEQTYKATKLGNQEWGLKNVKTNTLISGKQYKYPCIYLIFNSAKNLVYIGKTKQFYKRFLEHCSDFRWAYRSKFTTDRLPVDWRDQECKNFWVFTFTCNVEELIEKEWYYFHHIFREKLYNKNRPPRPKNSSNDL